MSRLALRPRSAYAAERRLSTRWADNDVYGHVNNVAYYTWFDSAVNAHLIERGVLDIAGGVVIGLVVESGCRYARGVAFPHEVTVALRVGHAGRSSVRYELGIFTDDHPDAAAEGHFVHVYVDRATRRPVDLPPDLRGEINGLLR